MSIEQHARARQIELGRSIARRRKVYLDACFWIMLRDVELGIRTRAPERKLLHLLRRGVASGILICPIGANMFIELMKQPDAPDRRQATARLIDELSLGVSAIDPQRRLGTEIHHFLLKTLRGEDAVHPMQELIWTKAAYVLGDSYPSLDLLPPAEELDVQRRFFDYLWELPLSVLVADMDSRIGDDADFADLTRRTNEQNMQHREELRSLNQTYDVELRGAIEIAGEIAADVLAHLTVEATGAPYDQSDEQRAASVNQCQNLLYLAMRKPKARSSLRTLHVGATIHARMRWNKARQFKVNDWHDFGHAGIALTYCDAFLTERPLHELVTRPEPSLETVNGCRVASDADAAISVVQSPIQGMGAE